MSVIGRQPGHDLDPKESGLTSRHLAYVIYTSGSTGRPKGAMNEHHALVNRLTWGQRLFPLDGTDRVLQKTPIGFDVSVWEMLHPLVTGATLVIARPQGHRDPAYLADIIEQAGITTLHFVPSMLQLFLEQLDEQNFSTHRFAALKHVLSGGEVLRPALRMAIHAALPNAKLFNLYGPSEAAIDVTSYACVQPLTRSAVPIGGAVDNTQIYVLDRHLRPVPTGVTGEICVGGVAVGRGYLNRPELTAERFLADPFREAPARLYRTGDLGRRLPDGNVEYAGRNDFQVKIRGFRIELGEIERVLLGFPDIKETVVIADTEFPGREKLIGYVVTTKAGPISSAVLRTRLKRHLPDYMLPTSWVFMGRLPLNDNGKVDRGALPKPDSDRLDLGVEFVSPQNEIETTLAQVWAQVLNVSRIGIHDDFFALGGHSISATQLIWQLNDRGMGVSVSALFQNPTVHSLARCIDIDVMTI
jgi:amino acid adenylation domain-containing protein